MSLVSGAAVMWPGTEADGVADARSEALLSAEQQVGAGRDAKLAALRDAIVQKRRQPLNAGNDKVIVFTARRHGTLPLRAQATQAKQLNRRVELNLAITQLEAERVAIRHALAGKTP